MTKNEIIDVLEFPQEERQNKYSNMIQNSTYINKQKGKKIKLMKQA